MQFSTANILCVFALIIITHMPNFIKYTRRSGEESWLNCDLYDVFYLHSRRCCRALGRYVRLCVNIAAMELHARIITILVYRCYTAHLPRTRWLYRREKKFQKCSRLNGWCEQVSIRVLLKFNCTVSRVRTGKLFILKKASHTLYYIYLYVHVTNVCASTRQKEYMYLHNNGNTTAFNYH